MYENIDMKKTGILLKETIEKAGYTVKDIQKILHRFRTKAIGHGIFYTFLLKTGIHDLRSIGRER